MFDVGCFVVDCVTVAVVDAKLGACFFGDVAGVLRAENGVLAACDDEGRAGDGIKFIVDIKAEDAFCEGDEAVDVLRGAALQRCDNGVFETLEKGGRIDGFCKGEGHCVGVAAACEVEKCVEHFCGALADSAGG